MTFLVEEPFMMRRCAWVGLWVVLASGAVLAVFPAGRIASHERLAAQPPAPADQEPKTEPSADSLPVMAQMLDQMIDMKDFNQQEMSLKEVLILLYEKLAATGKELAIIIDADAFRQENPDADVYDTKVKYPPIPRAMKLATALRFALNKVATNNATFVVKDNFIEITTYSKADIKWKLGEGVVADYQSKRVSEILRDLAVQHGCTIVIDKRAASDANRPVSATFRGDASLATIVRAVTDMVNLKIVALDGMLYVTTPVHAEELRKEAQRFAAEEDPLWPDWRSLRARPKEAAQ
jgi:hypothetical protein